MCFAHTFLLFQESISESVVRLFCKESYHLRLVRCGSSIADEYEGSSASSGNSNGEESNGGSKGPTAAQVVSEHFEQNPDSSAAYYFVLRGADRFATEFSTRPGALDDSEADVGKLKNCVTKVLSEYGVVSQSMLAKDDYVQEVRDKTNFVVNNVN